MFCSLRRAYLCDLPEFSAKSVSTAKVGLNLKFFAALDECTAGDLVTGALVAALLLCGAGWHPARGWQPRWQLIGARRIRKPTPVAAHLHILRNCSKKIGRRNRLPHQCKRCLRSVGGFACDHSIQSEAVCPGGYFERGPFRPDFRTAAAVDVGGATTGKTTTLLTNDCCAIVV